MRTKLIAMGLIREMDRGEFILAASLAVCMGVAIIGAFAAIIANAVRLDANIISYAYGTALSSVSVVLGLIACVLCRSFIDYVSLKALDRYQVLAYSVLILAMTFVSMLLGILVIKAAL